MAIIVHIYCSYSGAASRCRGGCDSWPPAAVACQKFSNGLRGTQEMGQLMQVGWECMPSRSVLHFPHRPRSIDDGSRSMRKIAEGIGWIVGEGRMGEERKNMG